MREELLHSWESWWRGSPYASTKSSLVESCDAGFQICVSSNSTLHVLSHDFISCVAFSVLN